jgi:2,4-dienoyl-CoA reductase-like NADH-dependent reductase (Old Yellow Enzyme family)
VTVAQLFEPAPIGSLSIRNRFIRSATSESMCAADGGITDRYVELYRALARGGAGLILTGHMFVDPRGRYFHRQTGIHHDRLVPALSAFTKTIHDEGATIFAELGHAGSQCRDPSITPLAPSQVENFISRRQPAEASAAEITEAIEAFRQAARRVREAGFDGVHLHAGHGYLISAFNSPHGNRRNDDWGGDADRRSRFLMAVYQAVRQAVGPDFPVTVKLGMADSMPENGLTLSESVARAEALEAAGVDAIEVSVGIMHLLTKSVGQFVAVTPRRAIEDLVFHRLVYPAGEEGYFLPAARALKARLKKIPVILVGGVRTTEFMVKVVADGDADFLSMARPFIREPDLPNQIRAGRRGLVSCVSCNICTEHEGRAPLKCWRVDKRDLLKHLVFRIGNSFNSRH